MADQEDVASFINVTGASPEAAAFFLDSSAGDVEAAVDAYFAADGVVPPPQEAAVEPTRAAPRLPVPAAEQAAPKPAAPKPAARKQPAAGKFKGLADLNQEGESEEDESNEYYAGGHKSGQVVKGNDNKNGPPIESLFERARQSGAKAGTAADLQLPGSSKAEAFKGRAHTLGGGDQPSAAVPTPEPAATSDQPVVHTITFWANDVFTVGDGEARNMTDPANRPFLEAIGRGECPPELTPEDPHTPINVNLVRSAQEYRPPERPRHTAFAGQGRTLAGPSSSGVSRGPGPGPSSSQVAVAGSSKQWEGVDESQPTTSIQLRLADGSRLVARFNHSHTVGDIRRFIAASRPDMPPNFSLVTAFPQAELKDDSATISASSLLNAVIIQKL